ncbi:hypothetical protein MASRES_GEN12945_04710 [Acinetobacter baumannii]
MNIKPAWDTKPDMFEGSISNITPQTQQSPLEEVGNGASQYWRYAFFFQKIRK